MKPLGQELDDGGIGLAIDRRRRDADDESSLRVETPDVRGRRAGRHADEKPDARGRRFDGPRLRQARDAAGEPSRFAFSRGGTSEAPFGPGSPDVPARDIMCTSSTARCSSRRLRNFESA